MKTYDKYKSSGVDWIGDIPENWKLKKLKYLVKSVDKTTSETSFLIAVENIESKTGKLVNLDADKTYQGVINEFQKGDVLFNKLRPYLAKVYYAEQDGGYVGELLNFRTGKELYNKFLYYRVFSGNFIDIVDSSTTGTKMPRASWEDFISHLLIAFPSDYDEQTAIADYLDEKTAQIDSLINNKLRLIELLKEERTAIINQAVTRGINRNAKLKPSGIAWLGDIPEHWEVKKLKYVVLVKARLGWRGLKASEYVLEGFGFLSTPNIKPKEIDFENINYITEERYIESPEIMLEVGDVLLAKDGSTLGTINVVKDLPLPSTVNSSIAVLRITDRNAIIPLFLKRFIESDFTQNVIEMIKDGMGVPHLFQADIKQFDLLLPPIEEQKQIVEFIETATEKIDATIAKIKKEIGFMREYRTALISEIVTGKIKI